MPSFCQAVEKVKKPYFPKLIARFPWGGNRASSPAIAVCGVSQTR